MKERFNTLINGLNFGILAPLIGCGLIYLGRFSSIAFDEYLDFISRAEILPKIIGLSALSNLLLFFIFLWLKMDKAGRGVVISTLLYGGLMVILLVINWFNL